MRSYTPTLFWYAIVLHFLWGLIILVYGEAYLTSPQAYLYNLFQSGSHLGYFYLLVSLIAVGGDVLWHRQRFLWALVLFLPQQFVVLISMMSSAVCAYAGMYADGTVRPSPFIASDQAPLILASLSYTFALAGRVHVWKIGSSRLRP